MASVDARLQVQCWEAQNISGVTITINSQPFTHLNYSASVAWKEGGKLVEKLSFVNFVLNLHTAIQIMEKCQKNANVVIKSVPWPW